MRKIFPLFILILFFLNLFLTQPHLIFAASDSMEETGGNLKNKAQEVSKCGLIGKACCKEGFTMIPLKIPPLQIIGLTTITELLLTPINSLLSSMDWLIDLVRVPISKTVGTPACLEGEPSGSPESPQCTCLSKKNFEAQSLCINIGTEKEREECIKCNSHGIWTALGCFDYELPKFIQNQVFGFSFGLAGITAFFCILYAAFLMQMSQGNPERVKKAQELLVACISGLILIIFSIFILKLIGVDILRIPGFTR